MAYVRRHWLSSVLYTLIIAFGLAIALTPMLFSDGTIREARAQDKSQAAEATPQIDPYLYTRVQKIRQELSLTTLDLAAMGCTEESATQVLETLKTWCTTNRVALDQHRRNELQVKSELRRALRQKDSSLATKSAATLQGELGEVQKARRDAVASLVTILESQISADQQLMWQNARDNVGLPQRLRYVQGITDTQRIAIRDGGTNDLTWVQQQIVVTARTNRSTRTAGVFEAEAATLPVPREYTCVEHKALPEQGLRKKQTHAVPIKARRFHYLLADTIKEPSSRRGFSHARHTDNHWYGARRSGYLDNTHQAGLLSGSVGVAGGRVCITASICLRESAHY